MRRFMKTDNDSNSQESLEQKYSFLGYDSATGSIKDDDTTVPFDFDEILSNILQQTDHKCSGEVELQSIKPNQTSSTIF